MSETQPSGPQLVIRTDIGRSISDLTRLIDDISKATRVGGEMALAESAPVNLAELLRTLTEVFGETLAKHRQKVVLDLDDSAAPGDEAFIVQGHDLRLGQVFSNLIDNALSFSPSDGAVAIKVRRDADMIVVAVEDDGPGIPAEALGKIFDRFYTYRPDVESFGNNSGLGLSISLEIIEAHGGTITAENRVASPAGEGRSVGVAGARLIVRLPALSPAAAHRAVRSRARRR